MRCSQSRKIVYAATFVAAVNNFFSDITMTNVDAVAERHADLFHPEEQQHPKAILPICKGLFDITPPGDDDNSASTYSFPGKQLIAMGEELSTKFEIFEEKTDDEDDDKPKLTLNLMALCALVMLIQNLTLILSRTHPCPILTLATPVLSQRLFNMKESDDKPGQLQKFYDHDTFFAEFAKVLNWMANPQFCPSNVESVLELQSDPINYTEPSEEPPLKKRKNNKPPKLVSIVGSNDSDMEDESDG